MIVLTRALNFEESKNLMIDLMNTKSKFIDENNTFNVSDYWITHFVSDYQYNTNSKWIHQIDIESNISTYIILKYCANENTAN